MYVCMCVCMYVCMYVCVCVYDIFGFLVIHVCAGSVLCAVMYVCMCVCVYVCIYLCKYCMCGVVRTCKMLLHQGAKVDTKTDIHILMHKTTQTNKHTHTQTHTHTHNSMQAQCAHADYC